MQMLTWIRCSITEIFLEKGQLKQLQIPLFPLILYFLSQEKIKQLNKFFCKCDPHDPNPDPDLYGNAGSSGSLYSISHGFRSATLLLKAYEICNELEESAIKGNLTLGWKIYDTHKEFIVEYK
jgi:hypothetical protein